MGEYNLRALEDKLIEADAAGDKDAVAVLSAEIVKKRAGSGLFNQFLGGFNEEIGGLIPPIGGGEWWQKNMVGPAPINASERVARGAGTGLGVAAEFFAPGAYLAKRGLLAAEVTAKTGIPTRIGKSILDTYRAAPNATAAIEAGMGALGGAGSQIGAEVSDSPLAPVVGGAVAALSPIAAAKVLPYTITGATARVARNLWRSFRNEEAIQANAKKVVYPQIDRAINTPEAQAELARTQEVSRKLGLGGKTDFTIAQKTNSPQLLRDQMSVEANASGSSLDALAARKRGVIQRISDKQQSISPTAGGDVAAVSTEAATQRIGGSIGKISTEQDAIQASMAEIAAKIPQTDKEAVGRGIRESLKATKEATKAQLSKFAKGLGLDADNVEFNFEDLAASVNNRFQPSEFGPAAPKMVARIKAYWRANKPEVAPAELDINKLQPGFAAEAPEKFTFRDLQDIRTSISDDITVTAASTAPDRNRKLRELLTLRKTVDEYVETAAPKANPQQPGLAENWAGFRQRWRDEYVNVFEKGRIFKALKSGRRDTYLTSDEMVADSFFSPTGVRQYLAAGGEPGALRAAALDRLNKDVVSPSGDLNVKKLQGWLKANSRNLPASVGKELESVRSAATALAERQNTLYLREQKIKDTLLAKALSRGGGNPDKFIDSAMKDPVVMRQALNAAKSNDTVDALRRAVWIRVFPDGQVDLATVDRVLKNNHRSLVAVFGKEHLDNIKLIRDGMEIESRTPMPQGTPEQSQDILSKIQTQVGTGVPQVASRAFAVASGRTSLRFVLTEMLGRLFMAQSKGAQERVFSEALVNPELAKEIRSAMTYGKPLKDLGSSTQPRGNLNVWLWRLGIPNAQDETSQ